ncbi:MAG TPA: DMT family transporter [Ramlibacter sp.]|uniref:DMT family transporter n=1 Tax=Ramlibacter sp. TaxID=1917967 RepID=UPI002CE82E2D|nr:DMT family transporter [Ramlibacter sp.]HVZ42730.1 DMT family transporter [Ramlibacter sp.]
MGDARGPSAAVAAVAALFVNAFVWGVSWWPLRELHALGLHPLWSTALVYSVSMLIVLAARPGAVRAFAREPLLWLLVAACGVTNVGFNWGVTVGDVVRVVLLFYLMPAWSVLLAWPMLGERPTRPRLARLALALAGVAIVLRPDDVPWPVPRGLADWLALSGGFSFALTNILLRRLQRLPTESRILAMFGGGAALAAIAGCVGIAHGVAQAPAGTAWAPLALGLGVAFLASNVCLQYGAARLPAHTTALVMLSEVVFASFSSVALGAGELTPKTVLGAALILAAAAWAAWPARDGDCAQGAQSAP